MYSSRCKIVKYNKICCLPGGEDTASAQFEKARTVAKQSRAPRTCARRSAAGPARRALWSAMPRYSDSIPLQASDGRLQGEQASQGRVILHRGRRRRLQLST